MTFPVHHNTPAEDQFMMIVLLTREVFFKDPDEDYTAGLKLPVRNNPPVIRWGRFSTDIKFRNPTGELIGI